MIKCSLESLQQYFEGESFQAQIEPETEISPKQLVVLIGRDQQNRDLLLRLTLLEETTAPPLEEKKIHFLQFFLLLPYQVQEESMVETSRLLMSINSSFDLSGFGMIEGNRLLYFRYVHIVDQNFSEDVLSVITDSMMMLLDTFLLSISTVADGKKTIKQLQEENQKALQAQEFEIL